MAWCPNCKNEYREGVKVCADCGCDLVETQQYDDLVPMIFGEEEKLNSIKKFMEYNKLKGVTVRFDESDEVYELLVREKDQNAAAGMARVFMQQEALREEEALEKLGIEKEASNPNHVAGLPFGVNPPSKSSEKKETSGDGPAIYTSSTERAEENRSSAWTLMIVGGIGMVAMILGLLGVIPLRLGNPYMFYGVMCTVFLLFIIMGFVSMKNAKLFDKKAESENSLRDAMVKWYQENLDPYEIDEELMDAEEVSDDTPEEILYFKRMQKIKDKFNHQFMNLDQVFLDHFIDEEVYDAVFSGEQE